MRSVCPRRTGGTLRTSCALRTLVALRPTERTLRSGRPLHALRTVDALRTGHALRALRPKVLQRYGILAYPSKFKQVDGRCIIQRNKYVELIDDVPTE